MCLKRGLKDNNWDPGSATPPVTIPGAGEVGGNYNGTYKHDSLKQAIKNLGTVDIVVAAGGLVSAMAASEQLASDNAFIFMAGSLPASGTITHSAGGVVLNTIAQNDDRRTKMLPALKPGIDTSNVFLVQNYNSEMTQLEKNAWFNPENVFPFFNQRNNSPDFSMDIKTLGMKNPSGLVVSADPYFRMYRKLFTKQLKTLNIPVCYPFKEFVDEAPAGSVCNWLGPTLGIDLIANPAPTQTEIMATAGWQLGKKVASFLTNPTSVGNVQWDGTMWI